MVDGGHVASRLCPPYGTEPIGPSCLADTTRGTGHFNVSQGAIATAAGLGGALSTAAAGLIVVKAGYSAAFLFLAGVAGAGLIGFATMMPETLRRAQDERGWTGD